MYIQRSLMSVSAYSSRFNVSSLKFNVIYRIFNVTSIIKASNQSLGFTRSLNAYRALLR